MMYKDKAKGEIISDKRTGDERTLCR